MSVFTHADGSRCGRDFSDCCFFAPCINTLAYLLTSVCLRTFVFFARCI